MPLPHDLKIAMPEPGKSMQEWRDDEEKGLIFRVTEKGDRRWSIRYINGAGEHRRAKIGPFPSIGLKAARTEARKLKGTVAGRVDVVGVGLAEKAEAERQRRSRLAGLAEEYFADCAVGTHRTGRKARAKSPRSIQEDKNYWENDIKPAFGDRPVASITRRDILDFVAKMTRRSAGAGRFCRNLIRQLLNYAVMKEVIASNPAQSIPVIEPGERTRFFSHDELRTIWRALENPDADSRLSIAMSLLIRMIAIAPLRVSEVAGMKWSEIDKVEKTLTVPAWRMKGKRDHIMPLSDIALALLDEAREKIGHKVFVFASPRTGEAMGGDTVDQAFDRLTKDLEIDDARCHDFRRTASTNLTRTGNPWALVKKFLAHAETDKLAAHYDMNDYLLEKIDIAAKWDRMLANIVGGKSNVIPIREAS